MGSSVTASTNSIAQQARAKAVVTWGTSASLLRSWCKGTWARSWPSMTTRPPVGSTIRKRVLIRVDLPHPVRPAMPIFSWGLMLRLKPFSTRSRSSLYRTCSSHHTQWSGECGKECAGQSREQQQEDKQCMKPQRALQVGYYDVMSGAWEVQCNIHTSSTASATMAGCLRAASGDSTLH